MVTKRYPRNEPCPCGSGKKYKKCCYTKEFEFTVDDQGTVSRTVAMTPELRELMELQRQRFIAKFGREPAPDDPIFFDPDADTPKPIEFDEAEMKREFGVKSLSLCKRHSR